MTAAMRRTALLRILGIVTGLAVGAVGMLSWDGGDLLPVGAGAFLAGAVVGELLPIRQPYGATVPMSLAVVGAMALIGVPPHVLASFAGSAWLLAAVVAATMGRSVNVVDLPRRILGGWILAAVGLLISLVDVPSWAIITPTSLEGAATSLGLNGLTTLAIGSLIILGIPLTEAVMLEARVNVPLRHRVRDSLRSTWQATIAIAATAALGAMVHPVLGAWTVPLMLAPLWAARVGVRRHLVVTNAYDQTIRAMSRLPEQIGSLAPGHGVRVGRLAIAVSNELGLPDQQVANVERAAYLHQLGRVPLEEDDPTPEMVADTGAGIILEAGDLDQEAEIVRAVGHLAELGTRKDPTAVGARIIWACSILDRYAPDYRDHGQVNEVLVRLIREVGDIEVVAALARVADQAPQPAPA